jgi:putative sterol carrier protein
MTLELFSDRWAQQWCKGLNASAAYRAAAADWQGAVALVMTATDGEDPRGVYMDAAGGICRVARVATEADLAGAAYVFEATPAVWREVFSGRTAPVMALFSGKLRLTRGSLAALMPHAGAARELIAAAAAVPVRFPGEG